MIFLCTLAVLLAAAFLVSTWFLVPAAVLIVGLVLAEVDWMEE